MILTTDTEVLYTLGGLAVGAAVPIMVGWALERWVHRSRGRIHNH